MLGPVPRTIRTTLDRAHADGDRKSPASGEGHSVPIDNSNASPARPERVAIGPKLPDEPDMTATLPSAVGSNLVARLYASNKLLALQ